MDILAIVGKPIQFGRLRGYDWIYWRLLINEVNVMAVIILNIKYN